MTKFNMFSYYSLTLVIRLVLEIDITHISEVTDVTAILIVIHYSDNKNVNLTLY